MMRKYLKKIVILSFFFLLVFGIGSNSFTGPPQTTTFDFEVIIDGEIFGWNYTNCTQNSIVPQCERKHYTTRVLAREVTLDWNYFRTQTQWDGFMCFPEPAYTSTMAITEERDGNFSVYFHIRGHDTTGSGNAQYGLHLYGGSLVGGTERYLECDGKTEWRWPPQVVGDIATIVFYNWEIIVEGYRAPKKKQGKKCVGFEESTSPIVSITVKRLTDGSCSTYPE